MKKMMRISSLLVLCAGMLSFAITGCGVNQVSPPSTATVNGVAATGAPVNGSVTLQDSSTPSQIKSMATAADGSFSFSVNGLQPPFVLTASWTDSSGQNALYSFTDGPGIVNINPFSNAAFAASADVTDQSLIPATPDSSLFRRLSSRHRSVENDLKTALSPLFDRYSTHNDPIHDEYKADHHGLDAMFDDVSITVSHGMITVTNKETGAVIYEGPISDLNSGTFDDGNMPSGGTGGTGGGTGQLDGAALYGTYCSSCHGQLATSSVSGVSADQIQSAISSVGAMGSLSTLTTEQIQAIAAALSPTAPTACTYTYSSWGACQSDGTQTRTMLSSSPAGCTGTPLLSQTCTYVPPQPTACTYTYSAWGACQSDGTQTRTMLSSSPAGCTGTPLLSQTCTPPVLDGATLYGTYCSSCHRPLATSTKLGRTSAQIQAAISSVGAMSSLSSLSTAEIDAIAAALATAPQPAACTYTYSSWGACQSDGTQTRTMLSSSPAGCAGTPVLSQTCTYVPPPPTACTYTYSAWGACQPDGTQIRTMLSSSPAGCVGTPLLSQTCTYVPPAPTITNANVTTSCTSCHGLTVNTTVFRSGGYTITGRTASQWLTTVNRMVGYGATLTPSGVTAQDYANYLATVP